MIACEVSESPSSTRRVLLTAAEATDDRRLLAIAWLRLALPPGAAALAASHVTVLRPVTVSGKV